MTMPAPRPDALSGPDHTLVQLAEWLTLNASTFDTLFAQTPGLLAVHIQEDLTEQHPQMEHEATTPVARFRFEFTDGRKVDRRNTDMLSGAGSHLLRAVHADGSGIRAHCVINDEPLFHETYSLSAGRDGSAEGRIRHWDFDNVFGFQELMEQIFTWRREGLRYVGLTIEMRLYGGHITTFLKAAETDKAALLANPAQIFSHRVTAPYREKDFRPLFQMHRSPARIELRSDHVAVIFGGEGTTSENVEQP
jgi:hypothetical protein